MGTVYGAESSGLTGRRLSTRLCRFRLGCPRSHGGPRSTSIRSISPSRAGRRGWKRRSGRSRASASCGGTRPLRSPATPSRASCTAICGTISPGSPPRRRGTLRWSFSYGRAGLSAARRPRRLRPLGANALPVLGRQRGARHFPLHRRTRPRVVAARSISFCRSMACRPPGPIRTAPHSPGSGDPLRPCSGPAPSRARSGRS
jgi:hypothetical protein